MDSVGKHENRRPHERWQNWPWGQWRIIFKGERQHGQIYVLKKTTLLVQRKRTQLDKSQRPKRRAMCPSRRWPGWVTAKEVRLERKQRLWELFTQKGWIFISKAPLWKYGKCETCDHCDIPIAYVTREGVASIFMRGSCECSENYPNAEHGANLRTAIAAAAAVTAKAHHPAQQSHWIPDDQSQLQPWWMERSRQLDRKTDDWIAEDLHGLLERFRDLESTQTMTSRSSLAAQ